ncbi:histone deacetylase family protein [Pseudomonas soli]|jgi:acetoin utilization deacetylase AcuC-like enzyme|uniref:Acetoin utilization deacetylase AcuC n=1 Tax=Pseudomonas soli TaxID=1306993 RepID=A0A1H9DGW0_9PSED|nr:MULTISPECIES: histone deacetylase family protein [Pseudomonas]AUY32555.1 histone deacetylase family protein [Pseudomonas sp. PONIH3]MEE1882778.1 histone deacetylase family protein [Pseudomonas soli]NBK40867.1 histone deacetylase family protein [Pseudomonas soli]WJO24195.1 histone deacetylase family protein [Pseudomonas soli]SEQ12557.1 Acetoin utilization deacetylase AcuC [Pseudomonas soli]
MRCYFHPEQLLHHPRSYYSRGAMRTPQEVPERAQRLLQAAKDLGFDIRKPEDAGLAPLKAVHGEAYLAFLEEAHARWKEVPEDWGDEVMSNIFVREPNALRGILAQAGRYLADGSCPVGEHTWRSAYWSAQSAVAAAQAILDGESATYALCRPPGHHARYDAAGGFCYLNNAAVAAQVLRGRYQRVAILDTDMHHGQGIQEIFYERDDVLYVSVHGDPTNFYPGVAGFADERGSGAGEGCNLNLPMAHGASEADFMAQLEVALQAVKDFGAEVLVLSLGFDIYELDPQSKVAVTTEGFARLGEQIRGLRLPCLIVQEGGYHLESLEANARAFFGEERDWR